VDRHRGDRVIEAFVQSVLVSAVLLVAELAIEALLRHFRPTLVAG
jgi:hypothetical protein